MAKKQQSEEKKTLQLTDLPGVGQGTSDKLIAAGKDSVLAVAVSTPSELAEIVGMTEASARKIVQFARENLNMGFVSGIDLETEQEEKGFKISTGCPSFDRMLDGGIKSGGITEVYGPYATGKSQLAHVLTAQALKQFPDGYVVYVDTEGTLRVKDRLRPLIQAAGVEDVDEAVGRVIAVKVFTPDHQMLMVEKIEELFGQGKKVVLVIVDSIIAQFRAVYQGRGQLADRQQKINKHLRTLQRIADVHNIPVFVTNQVSSNPAQMYGDPNQAVGGNVLAHAMLERIALRKGQKDAKVAKLMDSVYLPMSECTYRITESGLVDAE